MLVPGEAIPLRRFPFFLVSTLAIVALLSACSEPRAHSELMAGAVADLEAIHLESAMQRFDAARTAEPEDPEAHRQYALLASYFDLHARAAEAWEHVLELEPTDAPRGMATSMRCAGQATSRWIAGIGRSCCKSFRTRCGAQAGDRACMTAPRARQPISGA